MIAAIDAGVLAFIIPIVLGCATSWFLAGNTRNPRRLSRSERLSESNAFFQRAAIRGLQTVPHPNAQTRLVPFLENQDDGIILEAVTALGFVGSVDVVKDLIPLREDLCPHS